MTIKLPVEKSDFTRPPPLVIPTEVVRKTFSPSEILEALDISRSALHKYSIDRDGSDYAYIPADHTEKLFELAAKKHIDLIAVINEWFESQGIGAAA